METCRWQAEAGHKVTLIHGQDADPWWQDNPVPGVVMKRVRELVHPVEPLADMRALTVLGATYRALKPDVIHTHQSKAGILGRLAANAVPEAVVAHTIHIVPFEGVSKVKRAFYIGAERLVAGRTDVFIGVSEAVGHAYARAGIIGRGRVHCVRSGMDLARFRNAGRPKDWRALLGVRQGEKRPRVVLMLAAFERRKRHVEFLQAYARIVGILPDTKLLLAGAGPERERVQAEVQALGLQDRVVFCGHRQDPEALLALADVSVLTSEREGLPRVVVQSIAAGCPVLVTDMPGIDEVVQDGINGHVHARNDLDGIVARVGSVLGDETALRRLRSGAVATNVDPWSLAIMGARVTSLYAMPDKAHQNVRAA